MCPGHLKRYRDVTLLTKKQHLLHSSSRKAVITNMRCSMTAANLTEHSLNCAPLSDPFGSPFSEEIFASWQNQDNLFSISDHIVEYWWLPTYRVIWRNIIFCVNALLHLKRRRRRKNKQTNKRKAKHGYWCSFIHNIIVSIMRPPPTSAAYKKDYPHD